MALKGGYFSTSAFFDSTLFLSLLCVEHPTRCSEGIKTEEKAETLFSSQCNWRKETCTHQKYSRAREEFRVRGWQPCIGCREGTPMEQAEVGRRTENDAG